jgi:hypothetical protein
MNEAAQVEQEQAIAAPLDASEREAVDALVRKHKANAAFTQQLALDASRLVATSQERLSQQSEAGFFKRITNAFSGKTTENQLLNQTDMLQMQKFAWHYLQQLQQQNLINAQSIAVIRNNLGTMNDYIIETRDFLEHAIDKIDQRLRHVENHIDFNTWALNIEANKRRLKSTPRTMLILRLTYGFWRSHKDSNYLVTTLNKLDIDCDEELQLLDFISELIDQIEVVGIDQYRAIIDLAFDGHTVESEYIQRNISGTAFNALYFLSDQYERIMTLIGDDGLCDSDEDRQKCISKFFGSEFSGLSSIYSIRDLICEMIGGSQLAIDVYKDEHGLNAVQEDDIDESQPEVVTLISALPEIRVHTFLDSRVSDESRRNYLLLLALAVENSTSLNAQAREFLSLLADKSGIPGLQQQVLALADGPRKQIEYQPVMQALLDDDNKKYTWLLDAFFLLTLAQKPIESPQVKSILGTLRPAQLKEMLPHMLAIVSGTDTSRILDAGIKLREHTPGWKNVVRYRELRFDPYYAEANRRLDAASWAITRLILEMSEVYGKGMEHAFFMSFSDGSLMSNLADKAGATVCAQGRKSALSSLNEIRKKAASCISENRSALSHANSMISCWSIPTFEFDAAIISADFDLDNSAGNEDWGSQFEHLHRQIDETLNAFSSACDGASEQLGLFAAGDFDQSVLKLREQKHAEYLRKRQQEKLEKQCATVIKDDKEHLFGIEWQRVEHPPCDPNDIRHVRTDGKVWLLVANVGSDDRFYRSEDGTDWQQVYLDAPGFNVYFRDIDIVNGVWLISNGEHNGTREEGFYYSLDALNWRHVSGPGAKGNSQLSLNAGHLTFGKIIHFNGRWLWSIIRYQKYSYTEKGFLSDSTKTSNYAKTLLYSAQTLDGPWELSDQTPDLPEGVEVKGIYSLPGKNGLLAFCEYDSSYIRKKKKPETPPFVMYYGAAKAWQNCTWDGRINSYSSGQPIFVNKGERLMCIRSGEILVSEQGYDWRKHEATVYADEYFPLKEFDLFTQNNNSSIYLSQDTKQFSELTLEEGVWRHLTANDKGILAVYYANKHEETILRLGRYICEPRN